MTTRGTQCEPSEHQSTSFEIKSSSNTVQVDKVNYIMDYLDLAEPLDLERLKQWCHSHWLSTFRKALLNRNLMQYHSCCNSFSRRHFSKLAGHPADMTMSLSKVQAFKNIESGDDLYVWLLQVAKENERLGKRTQFPMLNRRHYDPNNPEGQDPTETTEKTGCLRKRCEVLERELEQQRSHFKDLLEDNSRLLQSSKAWHAKYEQLLEQHDTRDYQIDIFSTPIKHRVTNFASSFHNSHYPFSF